MLVAEYNKFVQETDQYSMRDKGERHDIATYGLVGEIGSVVSAVKKQLLEEEGKEDWNFANDEIIEELGDVIWYCFSLSQIVGGGTPINIFVQNIALIKKEIGADDERARIIHAALNRENKERFLALAASFPRTKDMCFDDYQSLAFLTARTNGKALLKVCIAVLWQLGAELLRSKLPKVELALNQSIVDRKATTIIGEIAWHLSAIASLYRLSLDEIVAKNVEKASYRLNRGEATSSHDAEYDEDQRFPRKFEIAFITVAKGRSRMYFEGKQLGDELTDNARYDDGYRFHDVMHLANIAHLGWSPVVRGLMGRKRKRDKVVDEVEDGARAKIVEEAIVKIIHSEGVRLAARRNKDAGEKPVRLFPMKEEITFKFLKFIHGLTEDLEVAENRYWEWEDAIMDGYSVFYELCREEQGTVTVDLDARRLTFRPEVHIDIEGTVSGIGSALVAQADFKDAVEMDIRVLAAKRAIFEAIGMSEASKEDFEKLKIQILNQNQVVAKATDSVQTQIWKRNIVNFKITLTRSRDTVSCTALAIADPSK